MLDWRNIPVEFGGLDTKSAPSKVIPGKLLSLQNGTFVSPGQIRKRNGYTALTQSIIGSGGSISGGSGLASYNSELLLFGGGSMYSYSPTAGGWSIRGNFQSVNVTSNSIVRNTYAQTAADMGQSGNLQLLAWEDSRGGIRYSIVDTVTGTNLVRDSQMDASCQQPKVLVFGSAFVVLMVNGGTGALGYYYISTATPTSISSFQTISNAVSTSAPNYDACVMGGVLYGAFNTGTAVTAFSVAALGGSVTTRTAASEAATTCVGLIPDSANSKLACVYYNGTSVKLVELTSALSVVTTLTLETLSNVTSVTGVATSSTAIQVFYTVSATLTYNYGVRTCTVTSYVAGAASQLLRSVALAGKAFAYSGTAYVPVVFSSPLQPTYFIADSSGSIWARFFAGTAGGIPTRSQLAEVQNPSTAVYGFPALVVDELTTNPGTTSTSTNTTPLYTLTGVNTVALNFADTVNGYLSATLASNLHVSGGFLQMYDALRPVEHGFHVYPEGVTSSVVMLGGTMGPPSGVSTVDWQTSATYEWTDNQGQIHESSPSAPNTAYLGPQPSGTGTQIAFVNNETYGVMPGLVQAGVTSYSAASTFVIPGFSTTNTSTVVGSLYSPTIDPTGTYGNIWKDYLFPGMTVSCSTAGVIPAGTTLVNVSSSLTLSQAATATASPVTLTFGVQQQSTGSTVVGQTLAPLAATEYLYLGAQFTAGSTTVQVSSTAGLAVGQRLVTLAAGYVGGTTSIASIGTNSITISPSGAMLSSAGYVVARVEYLSNGTQTNTSPNITGCTAAAVAYAAARTGPSFAISGSNIPAGAYILSASGTTITMSANSTATGSVAFNIWFSGDMSVATGGTVTASNLPAGTTVVSKTTGSMTLSQAATSTVSSQTFTFPNTFQLVHSVPTLRLTAKQGTRAPPSVVTYRTTGDEDVFYRSSSASSPTYNVTTQDTVALTDSLTDTALVGAPQLYTTGSVLENSPAPPCSMPIDHKGRLWVLDTTNPLTLWYSKQVVSGTPIQFSSFLTLDVDPTGGNITGLASIDDRLIIFKTNSIFVLQGDGPDSTGANNTFGTPVRLPTDSGCVNLRSLVVTPAGVMFQSSQGIQLLDRSLSVSYIGKDVEGLIQNQTVTSARLVQSPNQVRFTLGNGTALVYDLLTGFWSSFTNHAAVDVAFYGGVYTMAKSTGAVWTEAAGTYTDAGSFVPMSLTTSWLQLAGIQGFQRVRRALVFGDYENSHNLVVAVSYDFASTPTQTDTIAVTSPPTGAEQYRIHLANQKCQAIQFTISDTQNGAAGESLRITGLTLEVAVKKGLNKIPAANSYG